MFSTLRALAECYQAFELMSGRHVRGLGLTPPQFDIVATLGRTPGMSCRELGERTLLTKGTLTGVLDRLEERGLLRREVSTTDRRSFTVRLTSAGDALFEQVFPAHEAYLRAHLRDLSEHDLAEARRALARLRQAFSSAVQELPA